MTMGFMSRARVVGIVALALCTFGCGSPEPHFYTLQPVPGAVQTAPGQIVEVRRPGLAGYLDRSDVVLKDSGYQLQVNSIDRWAEPLGDMIGRVITQDLAQRLPASSVFSESGAISADPGLRVEIDVQRFDSNADGTLTLVAALAIEQGIGHVPLRARTVTLSAAPAQVGAAAQAAAMSGLLGQLADQVAGDIAGLAVEEGQGALPPGPKLRTSP
jgi:uncharacterized lipoprotein YmbA